MASQLDNHRHDNLVLEYVDALKTWKNLIDTHLKPSEKAAETEKFQELVKEFCFIETATVQVLDACKEVEEYFNDESADSSVDVKELYQKKLADKDNFSVTLEDCKIWKSLFSGVNEIEEVHNEAEEPLHEGDYEELNDSIFYSNVFTPPVDPFSKQVIKDPYKSSVCGHIYEHKFIVQYIKSMKNKAKCPYIGCQNKNLSMNQLVADLATQSKIQKYLSQKSQDQDSD